MYDSASIDYKMLGRAIEIVTGHAQDMQAIQKSVATLEDVVRVYQAVLKVCLYADFG